MNVILKQIRRKPIVWAGLLIALTLAVAVSLVGLSAWSAIERQASAINDNFITIAIFQDSSSGWEIYNATALETALNSGSVVSYDSRCMLGAVVAGTKALTSGAVERNDYDFAFDYPSYNLSVFAINCTGIAPTVRENSYISSEYDSEGNFVGEREVKEPPVAYYNVSGTVNEMVSLAAGYEPPKHGDQILISTEIHRADGVSLFEVGKQYMVFAYFADHPITEHYYETTDENTGEFAWKVVEEPDTESPYDLSIYDSWGLNITDHIERYYTDGAHGVPDREDWYARLLRGQRDDGVYYYYPMPEAWTHVAEYSGSVEEFLESEAGREWREEIIPRCELNQSSATVVLTDNLQSVYMFNNGFAELVNGREISAEEYVNGENVCLVSAEYAKHNNLDVGDRINIDYYDTPVAQQGMSEGGINGSSVTNSVTLRHGVLTSDDRIGVQKDYEIVGIYSAPAFRAGTHLFTADTIFAPKKSLPNAEKYEERGIRALQSLVLRNGSEEEFFEGLKHCRYEGEYDWEFEDPNDIDFSGDFMTFNQQYDKAAGNIEVMRSNARRLLILAVLGFLIVLTAVRYFEARRQRAIVVTMKKLGIARRRIVRELIGAGLLLDLTATALGGLAAWLLFGEITRRANVGTLQLPLTTLLLSAAATAIVLTLTTVFSASRLSRIALMETKK